MDEAEQAKGALAQDPLRQTGRLPRRGSGITPFRHGLQDPPRWPGEEAKPEPLPNRYEIREVDGQRILRCKEAPGLGVRCDRGFAFSESEARKLGEFTLLLDGAGQFSPLVDDLRHLYNLDHHAGCQRAFTLATCEQALILVLKGLDLDKGDWTIYVNEPDLDTLFAIWVLLNYRRVRALSPAARDVVFPLLRLEGAIDANGFEVAEACGLTQDQLHTERARLDQLHQRELAARQSGAWADLAQYCLDMLFAIDKLVFSGADFSDVPEIEKEYGHVNIGRDRVAVVCRDQAGIYEVEQRLKKIWGERLGIIALEKEPNHYTLRRAASLAGIALANAYAWLNLLDPAVDGHPPEKRWGGSDDIGGSPRPQGTGLLPREVSKILKLAYEQPTLGARLQRLLTAILWTCGLVALAGGLIGGWRWLRGVRPDPVSTALQLGGFGLLLTFGAAVLTRRLSRGWTWLFGWRRSAGHDWLALAPAVLLPGLVGGVWVPPPPTLNSADVLLATALGCWLAALGLELTFRGLTHGLLVLDFPIEPLGGRWFVSWPTLIAALLYALLTAAAAPWLAAPWLAAPWLAAPWLAAPLLVAPPTLAALTGAGEPLLAFGGALLAGLALGMIRERSLSVVPGIVLLFLSGLLRLGIAFWPPL